jgi:hypothetical protein
VTIMFDESKHRRETDGTFATKGFAAADEGVSFQEGEHSHATLTVPSVGNLRLADDHPHLPPDLRHRYRGYRVLTVERNGQEEAYLAPGGPLAESEVAYRNATSRADRERPTFTEDELSQFEPAPLQSPVRRPSPRLRDLDTSRVPRHRRAKVDAELDRPLTWLPPRADGTAGTIRSEIEAGRIVGKKTDSGGTYFMRTSVPEGSSKAQEGTSRRAIGVSKSLFKALGDGKE